MGVRDYVGITVVMSVVKSILLGIRYYELLYLLFFILRSYPDHCFAYISIYVSRYKRS